MTQEEIYKIVRGLLVDALSADEEQVTPNARLQADLNAESIDMLDIVFRIEREFGLAGAIGEFSISLSAVGRRQWDSHGARYGQRFGRLALEFSTRF